MIKISIIFVHFMKITKIFDHESLELASYIVLNHITIQIHSYVYILLLVSLQALRWKMIFMLHFVGILSN